jgi:hypothetical protein
VWFFGVPLTAADIRSLDNFKSLTSVSLLYDKGSEPNGALVGFDRIGGTLQEFSLRGQFDPTQAAAAVSRLTQCRSLTLENIDCTPELIKQLHRCAVTLDLLSLGTCALSPDIIDSHWNVTTVYIRECKWPAKVQSDATSFPRLRVLDIQMPQQVVLDGSNLLWLSRANELAGITLSGVRITNRLMKILLAIGNRLTWLNLQRCDFESTTAQDQLKSTFRERVRLSP